MIVHVTINFQKYKNSSVFLLFYPGSPPRSAIFTKKSGDMTRKSYLPLSVKIPLSVYLIAISFTFFSSTAICFFGISICNTPFSTFASILSFSTLSGRIMICWNCV